MIGFRLFFLSSRCNGTNKSDTESLFALRLSDNCPSIPLEKERIEIETMKLSQSYYSAVKGFLAGWMGETDAMRLIYDKVGNSGCNWDTTIIIITRTVPRWYIYMVIYIHTYKHTPIPPSISL